MPKRNLAFAALIVAALAVATSCDDAPEQGRAIVSITDVNNGSPVESDVLADSVILEDFIPVTFFNRPFNKFITTGPGLPHGDVIIERYLVEWTRTDGGSPALAAHEELTSVLVQSGETASGVLRLVTWEDKNSPVLSSLAGTANQVSMRADVTFFGRETGTEDSDIQSKTSVSVHFADIVN